MKYATFAAAAAVLVLGSAAQAGTVWQSVPDLAASPSTNAWCSSCGGSYEPLDQFTLGAAASVNSFRLTTQTGFYEGLGGFTVEIYDATHSSILFSQAVTPTVVSDTAFGTSIVTAGLSGLNLAAGTYWIGFVEQNFATPGFDNGGNGSLIDTTPHTGQAMFGLGGNIAYALYGGAAAPEPATWALMLSGFGLAGLALRGRRQALAAGT